MTDRGASDRLRERFDLIVNGPALFNAVATAAELRIFAFLSEHPWSTAAQIQASCGLPAHQCRVLMQALCVTELVVKRDGAFANSALAEEMLAPDGPDSWRDILLGWKRIYYPAFAEMTAALVQGTNTALSKYPGSEPTLYQRLGRDPGLERVFHRSMAAFSMRSMDALVSNEVFASVSHLLDVAGGDGTTAAQLIERYPGLRVTIFDLPSVSELAGEALRHSGKVSIYPGDFFTDDFPGGMDAILFSHCLEVFSSDQISGLLSRAADALPAGGKLLIYGYNVSGDETEGLYSARLSLYLNVLATGSGMAYPAEDYERWLRQAGLADVTTFTGLPYEHGLTVGTKPY
jgi:hypothetical protein